MTERVHLPPEIDGVPGLGTDSGDDAPHAAAATSADPAGQTPRLDAWLSERMFDSLVTLVGLCTTDGVLVHVNRPALVVAGIDPADALGKPLVDTYWWSHDSAPRERVAAALAAAAEGTPTRFDAQIRIADDQLMWIDFQVVPIRDEAGRVAYVSPSAVDITDRVRATAALAANEQRFREMIDELPLIVWMHDGQGELEYVNQTYCSFFGVSREELADDGWKRLTRTQESQEYVAAFDEAVRGRKPFHAEVAVRVGDGARRHLESWARPRFAPDGAYLGHLGTSADITERRDAEQALAASEAWLRLSAEATGLGFYDYDPQTRTATWSDELYDLWDLPRGSPLAFDKLVHSVHPDDRERYLGEVEAAFDPKDGPERHEFEYRLRRSDGQHVWVRDVGRTIWEGQGDDRRAIRCIGTVQDITPHKHAELALRASRDDLERRVAERTAELQLRADQLSRLSSDLTLAERRERQRLAKVLHDHLQQLLVAAKMSLGLIDEPSGPVRKAGAAIDDAIEASRALAIDLAPPILYDAGLAAALEWLGGWMRDKHGLRLTLDLDPAANPRKDDMATLLFECVRELLFNVVKHAGVNRAEVSLTQHDIDRLRIVVRDRGRGFEMPDEKESHARPRATLGLFSIQERLTLMGGTFNMNSEPGQGSNFEIIAPRDDTAEQAAASDQPRARESRPAKDADDGRIRLLIADDHPVVRQGLREVLEKQPDFAVVGEAGDGKQAVDLTQQLGPHIVLMDFSMPVMNGIDAIRQMREHDPSVGIIGVSMYEEPEHASAFMRAGADSYITKSDDVNDLIERIREIAGRKDSTTS